MAVRLSAGFAAALPGARLCWRGVRRPAVFRGVRQLTHEGYGRRPELYEDDVFQPIDEDPARSAYRTQPSSVYVHVPSRIPEACPEQAEEVSRPRTTLQPQDSQATMPLQAAALSQSQIPPAAAVPSPSLQPQPALAAAPSEQTMSLLQGDGHSPPPSGNVSSTLETTHSVTNQSLPPPKTLKAAPPPPAPRPPETLHSHISGLQAEPMQPPDTRQPQDVPGMSLEAPDWSEQVLKPMESGFYIEAPEVARQSPEEVQALLQQHGATLEGQQAVPKPVRKFEHVGFPERVVKYLKESGFTAPTPIQSIGWPIALAGHDMVGLAQTGSGKTLAYLLPALIHIGAQPPLEYGDGPIALVLAPTRELAMQIQMEAFRLGEILGIRDAVVYGGVARRGQQQELRRGVEILIATPGRLLDFLEGKVTNLSRVSYLVVDEADRMLDMGFEPQLRRVLSQVRPDRQTLMWSATWPPEIQHLARDFCKQDPVKLTIGVAQAKANPDICQDVHVVTELDKKQRFFAWLQEVCPPGAAQPRILVFTDTKRGADALCRELRYEQFSASAIHGDKDQRERDAILHQFRTGRCNILVATDVAQRGLDVKEVMYVVNYDMPKTIEDYVHRIGRTGRAGARGTAVSFFSCDFPSADKVRMARNLCRVMEDAGQTPPESLQSLATR